MYFFASAASLIALKPFLWVNIINTNRRSATITLLYWKAVPWRKRGFPLIPLPPTDVPGTDFPITLDDGKSAEYSWPLPEFVSAQAAKEFRDEFTGFRGAIRLQLLRLCVATSTGDVFSCKPEKELRDHIRKIATTSGP